MVSSIFSQILSNPAIQPYLPFFFVLAVTFGLLEIVNVFKKKSVNLVLALVFAFFAAGYRPFVEFFFQFFSLILWAFIIVFFIAMFMEALGLRKSKVKEGEENVSVIIGGIVLLIFTTIGIQFLPEFNILGLSRDDISLLIGLILLLIIFFYAYRYEKTMQTVAAKAQQG